MTQDELRAEHDRLYKEASSAVYPLIEIHGKPAPKLAAEQEGELRRGLALFDRVLQINPRNWAAMWLVGKGFQRLRDFESALRWFTHAHEINPTHPDVSREAAIAAMELGRPEEAIPFCERAIEAKPTDPGLRANLALATLFAGDAKRAASPTCVGRSLAVSDRVHATSETSPEVAPPREPCPLWWDRGEVCSHRAGRYTFEQESRKGGFAYVPTLRTGDGTGQGGEARAGQEFQQVDSGPGDPLAHQS